MTNESRARIPLRSLCILALALGGTMQSAQAAAGDTEPPVKLSTGGLCHERGTRFYSKTTNFTPFRTLDACLRAGGRLPVGVRPMSGAGSAPATPADVAALGTALVDAEVKQDRSALERLLDPRFRATLADGRTLDRSAFVDSILKSRPEPYRLANEIVEIHGDTALVISTVPGAAAKRTWVAVRKEGEWRVISTTFTKSGASRD